MKEKERDLTAAGQEGQAVMSRSREEVVRTNESFGAADIREFLNKGQYTRLRQVIQELNDADIADYLEDMGEEEIVKVFRILPKDIGGCFFLSGTGVSAVCHHVAFRQGCGPHHQ